MSDDLEKGAREVLLSVNLDVGADLRPSTVEERIARTRARAERAGVKVPEEYLTAEGVGAAEEYVRGLAACVSCESIEHCSSPYGGHVPVLDWGRYGRAEIRLRPCDKRIAADEQAGHEAALRGAAVPRGYAAMGFRNFQATEGTRDAYRAAVAIAAGGEKGVILWGPTGTGKTHLAVAALRNAMERGRTAAYLAVPEAVDRMRGDFGEAALRILDSVATVDLLLLDDLGAERRTDYTTEAVFRLVDRRLQSGLPTIVTTNWGQAELAARYGEVEGERIVSRLRGLGEWIEVQGTDKRGGNE